MYILRATITQTNLKSETHSLHMYRRFSIRSYEVTYFVVGNFIKMNSNIYLKFLIGVFNRTLSTYVTDSHMKSMQYFSGFVTG